MPVETIECQIVQAQLGRYLSGEPFSHEAMRQLEDHIADCQLCRQEVSVRRASLQALLGPSNPAMGRPDALIGALRESQATSTKTISTHAVVEQVAPESVSLSPQRFTKPLIFGSALALVLIAMTYIGRNPTSLFGDRAALPAEQTPPVVSPQISAAEPAPAPAAEPLNLDEWSTMGFASDIPFDSTDAETMEPWEWYSLSEALDDHSEESAPLAAREEASNEAIIQDWELFGLSGALEQAPASSTIKKRRISSVRPRRTRQVPNAPKIRIYEPGQ